MANVQTAVAEFRQCLDTGVPTGISTIKVKSSLI